MSVFFILSGFILAHRYNHSKLDFCDYFISRVARIYPVYFTSAVVTLPWLIFPIFKASGLSFAYFFCKIFSILVANLFLIQAFFPQMFVYWNDSASWSISTEMFFYLTFPALLGFSRYVGATKAVQIPILLLVYLATIFPGFVYTSFEIKPAPALASVYANPFFRLPEFLIGVLSYRLSENYNNFPYPNVLSFTALIIVFGYLGVVGQFTEALPINHNWIIVPILVVIIVLLKKECFLSRLLSNSFLVLLGRISYSFYAFQAFIIFIFLKIFPPNSLGSNPDAENACVLFLSFTSLLITSYFSYNFIEEPMKKRLHGFIKGFISHVAS